MWIPVLTTRVHPSTLCAGTFYSYGNGTMVLVVGGGEVVLGPQVDWGRGNPSILFKSKPQNGS